MFLKGFFGGGGLEATSNAASREESAYDKCMSDCRANGTPARTCRRLCKGR